MEVARRAFIASSRGAAAVSVMDHEARADALEDYTEDYTIERLACGCRPGYHPNAHEGGSRLVGRAAP